MSRVPVSCFIRTYNEEKRIKPVILAAREIVNEVIVIDSNSTDNTRIIAEEAGARIIQHKWLGWLELVQSRCSQLLPERNRTRCFLGHSGAGNHRLLEGRS